MKAIVAVDKKWGIGKNNGLLFSIPSDMSFFRQQTLGKVVVMGSNTLKSFPGGKPLKNRTNVVLSSKLERDDVTVVRDFDELKEQLKKYPSDDIFIIGGAMFYKLMLPYCSEVLVTKVDADGNADVFFENLDDRLEWSMQSSSMPIEDNGYVIHFTSYINSEIKQL